MHFWRTIVLLVFTAPCGFAQNTVSFDSFTVKDGLSQGFISTLLQDKEGFLWMGTMDGINRYDGNKVKIYRNDPDIPRSLPANYVTELAEDTFGNFWVGTNGIGLCYFDKLSERFFTVNLPGDPGDYGKSIFQLKYRNGFLFLKDENAAMVLDLRVPEKEKHKGKSGKPDFSRVKIVYRLSMLKKETPKEKLPANFFSYYFFLENKSIWFTSKGQMNGIVFDAGMNAGKSIQIPLIRLGLKPIDEPGIFSGKQGNQVLVVHTSGIVLYDYNRDTILYRDLIPKSEQASVKPSPHQYFKDESGYIYFLSARGAFRYDPVLRKRIEFAVKKPMDAPPFAGKSHWVSKDGFVWTGTGGYGLFGYNSRTRLFLTNPIRGYFLGEYPDGNVFMNSMGKLIAIQVKSGKVYPLTLPKLTQNHYGDLLGGKLVPDEPNHLYMALRDRVTGKLHFFRRNLLTQSDETLDVISPLDARSEFVHTFFPDYGHRIWQWYIDTTGRHRILLHDALSLKNLGDWTMPASFTEAFEYNLVIQLYTERSGITWLATQQGLFGINPETGKWQHYINEPGNKRSIGNNKVYMVLPDAMQPERYLWLATDGGGLNRFDKIRKSFERITTREGLPSNVVYAVLPDRQGNLWLSTTRGICCYHPQSRFVRKFSSDDGLAGEEFNGGQYLLKADGRMLFGGVDGLTEFDPKAVMEQPMPTGRVVITSLLVMGKPMEPAMDSSLANVAAPYLKEIRLPFHQNQMTIEYAILHFAKQSQKQYRYKLEGFNDNWIDNGAQNATTFTNLDPGTYRFRVNGRLTSGDWLKDEAGLTIVVLPPWYGTVWFIAAVILLTAGVLYGIYRYRLYQSLKVLQMRNLIASDLHDEIGSTLSSITVYSDIIQQNSHEPDIQQLAGRISNSSRNILVAMSDIVWSINPKNDRFDNILIRMQSYANELMDAQQKALHVDIDEAVRGLKLQMVDRKNFYLIFKEALNNAIKYSRCTNLWIKIGLNGGDIDFSIRDDGIGFDVNNRSDGNGIENMERRCKDLKGSFRIYSKPGEGTEIRVRFPAH